MLVKLLINKEDISVDDIISLFNWSVISEVDNSCEIIGDINETKLDNVKEFLVSKYIEQKVSSNVSSSTNTGATK